MAQAAVARDGLSADKPETWIEQGFEALFALSWRDCEAVQNEALVKRFESLKGSVAALAKLAKREGISSIDRAEDALPLLFDHRIYKSYPLALIENRNIPKLNAGK